MKIRVLGPFEVSFEGRDITPSAPKLRAVLTLLALNRGAVVRVDQLMSELWDDRPPPSASTTLQTYIYQLRKLLKLYTGHDDSIGLDTTQSGYVMRLPPGSLDAQEFEDLVAEGVELLTAGGLVEAVSILESALSLWRGDLLGAVATGPVLEAEIVRLEELRKSALEQRIDAELKLGRHRQLVGELSGLVAENPTHEGLRAKLMLALQRSGRRLDALDSYRQIHALLSQELGLEPCSELQKLHRHILAEDPILNFRGVPDGAPGPSSPGRPSQLPPNVFIAGRDSQLKAIERMVGVRDAVAPVVVLVGEPGSGKTALAVHAAHQIRADFPDGQLWAQLCTAEGEAVAPGVVLRDFLRAIGFDDSRIPRNIDERARMFRSWTASNRVLVVLDDAVCAEQLNPLLPSGSGCATILTCRRRLGHALLTKVVEATPLSRGVAWQVLVNALGHERVEREAEAVTAIIDSCAGYPAALGAVTKVLAQRPHWPVARMLNWRNGLLSSGNRPGAASARDELVEVVRRSYRLLSLPAQFAFRALATTHEPVSADDAAQILGTTTAEAEWLVEELVEVQLLEVATSPGTGEFGYRFIPLFRSVAAAFSYEEGEVRGPLPLVPGELLITESTA